MRNIENMLDVFNILSAVEKNASGLFNDIKCGDFYLSIQGGEGLYSVPKYSLNSLTQYEKVEISVLKKNGITFVNPYKVNHPVLNKHQKLFEKSWSICVAPYVKLDTALKFVYDMFEDAGMFGAKKEVRYGGNCRRCNEHNQYAQLDDDGKFLCWNCDPKNRR